MNIEILVALAVTAIYLILTFKTVGMQPSISDSFYAWKKKDYSAAFVLWTVAVAVCMMMFWKQDATHYKPGTHFLLLLAGVFLCGVSIAAPFRIPETGRIHVICTLVCITVGLAAGIYEFWGTPKSWIPTTVVAGGALVLKVARVRNVTTWQEILAIGGILFPFIKF